MSYKVAVTSNFSREIKLLSKKYSSLKNEIAQFIGELEQDPFQGTPLGKNCYKIRLSISSKGQGKSGGARIITFVAVVAEVIYLLSIYDKSSKESISDAELKELLKELK